MSGATGERKERVLTEDDEIEEAATGDRQA